MKGEKIMDKYDEKTKLNGIKKVIFFDDTEYVYEKSNNRAI